MALDRTIKCSKCGNRYAPGEMRYFQNAKSMICVRCANEVKHIRPESAKKEQPETKVEKKRFKCLKCRHIIMLKPGFSKICSFCGGTNLEPQDWNSDLDNLIDESGRSIYDH